MELEYGFLRVPYERLSQSFRSVQKRVVKDIGKALKDLNAAETQEEYDVILNLLKTLRQLIQNHMEADQAEIMDQFQYRLTLLVDEEVVLSENEPCKVRLCRKNQVNRLICAHLIAQGQFKTAESLVKELNMNRNYLDFNVFQQAHDILRALTHDRDTRPALEWCSSHASRLRRLPSVNGESVWINLELRLRLQGFIELVRSHDRIQAIVYAQEHFGALVSTSQDHSQSTQTLLDEIQVAMALLAFDHPETCGIEQYQRLFESSRWDELIERFRFAHSSAYGIGSPGELNIALQAGLCLLRTAGCSVKEGVSSSCPVCTEEGSIMSQKLPLPVRSQPQLICGITGESMNEFNPPMILPNGHVYGRNGLSKSRQHETHGSSSSSERDQEAKRTKIQDENDWIECVRTKERFRYNQLRPVFIL